MSRKGKARVLSIEEFNIVDQFILTQRYAKRNRAMFYLSFGLGLRACEIRGLKLEDVLYKDGITLKETVNLTQTKGGKAREIYLTNKKLIEVLNDHINYLRDDMHKKGKRFCLNKPLFISQKGGSFYNNRVTLIFSKFYRDSGMEGAKSHSGRRTFITHKIDEGHNIKSISELVGHSSIKMTISYYQSSPTKLKKISESSIF